MYIIDSIESVLFIEVSSIQVCPYIGGSIRVYTVHVCILHVTIEAAIHTICITLYM